MPAVFHITQFDPFSTDSRPGFPSQPGDGPISRAPLFYCLVRGGSNKEGWIEYFPWILNAEITLAERGSGDPDNPYPEETRTYERITLREAWAWGQANGRPPDDTSIIFVPPGKFVAFLRMQDGALASSYVKYPGYPDEFYPVGAEIVFEKPAPVFLFGNPEDSEHPPAPGAEAWAGLQAYFDYNNYSLEFGDTITVETFGGRYLPKSFFMGGTTAPTGDYIRGYELLNEDMDYRDIRGTHEFFYYSGAVDVLFWTAVFS